MTENDEVRKRIEEEERVRVEVRAKLDRENAQAEKEKMKAQAKKIAIWAGAILILCMILGEILGGPDVVVEGDVGKIKRTVTAYGTIDLVGFEVAGDVYNAAKKYPNLKKIVLTLYMSPSGLQDKYGKAATEESLMGQIPVSDLDEVRKYESASTYQIRQKESYSNTISLFNHAHILKD